MYNTTSRRSRYSAAAAAIATTAIIFGSAACGSETASDNGQQPAAPVAPAPKAQATPHSPTSADAAERRAYAEQQEQYRRHLEAGAVSEDLKLRRGPGHPREIPIP